MAYYPNDAIYSYKTVDRDYVKFSVKFPKNKEATEFYDILFNVYYHEATDSLEGKMIVDKSIALDVTIPRYPGTKGVPMIKSDKYLGIWSINLGEDQVAPVWVKDDGNVYLVTGREGYTIQTQLLGPYATSQEEIKGYMYPAFAEDGWQEKKTELKIVGLLKPKKDVRFGCLSRGVYYTKALAEKAMLDALHSQIVENADNGLQAKISSYVTSFGEDVKPFEAFVTYPYTSWADGDNPVLIQDGMAMSINTSSNSSLASLISIGTASSLDQDVASLRAIAGLKTLPSTNESGLVTSYSFKKVPSKINIYLKDFQQKDRLTSYLDQWNKEGDITLHKGTPEQRTIAFESRAELTYTDTIGMIITVVDYLINAITIALVLFVSLALVVSCFMIAVITYISTMERVKEIGVIRSLGGRKLDVSRLFIAECLITGFSSGFIGVVVTYLICVVANIVVAPFGVTTIAILAPLTALVMIALSIVLNVLSGLIPSMRASRQDPVKALRSE